MGRSSCIALRFILSMALAQSAVGEVASPSLTVTLNEPGFPKTAGYHVIKATALVGKQAVPFACGMFLPTAYFKTTGKMPMVVSLHTRGNSGSGGGGELVGEGLGLLIAGAGVDPRGTGDKPKDAIDLPKSAAFIALMPQCPAAHGWADQPVPQILAEFITQVAKAGRGDEDRVYLTGFSYGGSSTWEIALQVPDRFAGIVPVDGRSTRNPTADVQKLKDVAIYQSVGSDDPDFIPDAKRMSDALISMKHARFIDHKVQGGNHWCYGSVYTDPEFWKWLFAQRRKSKTARGNPTTIPTSGSSRGG